VFKERGKDIYQSSSKVFQERSVNPFECSRRIMEGPSEETALKKKKTLTFYAIY